MFWADPSGADANSMFNRDTDGEIRFDKYGNYIPKYLRESVTSNDGRTNYYRSEPKGPRSEFDSAEEAAIDFGELYNSYSILESVELFTIIYKLDNGKFSYLEPAIGGGGFIHPSIVNDMINEINKLNGAEIYADVHTHGSDPIEIRELVKNGKMKSNANAFSGDYTNNNPDHDGDLYTYKNLRNNPYGKPIKGYMIAPNGGLYYFDPEINYGKKGRDGNIHYEFKIPINKLNIPSDPYQGKQRLNLIDPVIYNNLKFFY